MAGGANVGRRKSAPLSKAVDNVQEEIDSQGERRVDRSSVRYGFVRIASVQLLCGAAVYIGLWIAPHVMFGFSLIPQPVETLRICVATSFPFVLFGFSTLRLQPEVCSVWRAAFRGILSLPVGMVVASFLATVFGAPITYESVVRTLHWGALVSTLTVVPVATVTGGSWPVWHRLFAVTKPNGSLELALCLPAHGAVIGSWVGAWPMPLDWERPWQEWPVSCTYGAVGGYLLSIVVSISWSAFNTQLYHKEQTRKAE